MLSVQTMRVMTSDLIDVLLLSDVGRRRDIYLPTGICLFVFSRCLPLVVLLPPALFAYGRSIPSIRHVHTLHIRGPYVTTVYKREKRHFNNNLHMRSILQASE